MAVNKLMLTGTVNSVPEIRSTQSGLQVATFLLTSSERYKDEVKTTVHECMAFGDRAQTIAKILQPGQFIFAEGKVSSKARNANGRVFYNASIVIQDVQVLSGQPQSAPVQQSANLSDFDIPF